MEEGKIALLCHQYRNLKMDWMTCVLSHDNSAVQRRLFWVEDGTDGVVFCW